MTENSSGRSGLHTRAFLVAIAALIAIAIVVAGCGGSSDSSGSTETQTGATSTGGGSTEAAGGSTEKGVTEAEEAVAAASNLTGLKFPKPPQEPFSPGQGTAAVISCSQAGETCRLAAEEAQTAFKAAGWQTTGIGDGKASPTVFANLIQEAVQKKVDVIWMGGVEAASVSAAVEAAANANIPIVCWFCINPPEFKGKVFDVVSGAKVGGELLGNYIVAKSEGKAKVMIMASEEIPLLTARTEGTRTVLAERCPNCEVEESTFNPNPEITEPGPPSWNAVLSSHPKGSLEWVTNAGDPQAVIMAKTAIETGRTEVKMTGIEATPEMVGLIQKGEVAAATVFTNANYAVWASVDEGLRLANGDPTWNAENIPSAIVDPENVGLFAHGEPETFDYRGMFEGIWSGS